MTPDLARQWAPLAVALACLVIGLLRGELALIGVGAGVLGLPGYVKATPLQQAATVPLPSPQEIQT